MVEQPQGARNHTQDSLSSPSLTTGSLGVQQPWRVVSFSFPPHISERLTVLSHCKSEHTFPEQLSAMQSCWRDKTSATASLAQHHVP